MQRKRPSIQDVARVAGVSTATVSRALSRPASVSDARRALVQAAVQTTGYAINPVAQNLRRRRTGSVVALVPNLANPFFSRILSGVSEILANEGYSLLISDTRGRDDIKDRHMRYLDEGRADGLILLDGTIPLRYLDDSQRDRPLPPAVTVCEWIGGLQLPCIRIDNEHGATIAIEHLHALGHRSIGYIRGPDRNVLSISREAGMRKAMARLGLSMREGLMFEGDFSFESGVSAATSWMTMSQAPTAVFSANDEMAIGFMGALLRAGVSIPQDVSIIGFDDIELAAHVTPALTTIKQPRIEIGQVAARTLLDLIGRKDPSYANHVLPVQLVVRSSTCAR